MNQPIEPLPGNVFYKHVYWPNVCPDSYRILKQVLYSRYKGTTQGEEGEITESIMRSDKEYQPKPYPSVIAAISNICNLNCPMCRSQDAKTPKGNMHFDLFKMVVHNGKRMGAKNIYLHNLNEPILHPQIFEFLLFLEDNGIKTKISSNGQVLNRFIAMAMKQQRLPIRLCFRYSIDAGTKEIYEEMRYRGSFDKLIENLELIETFCHEKGIEYDPGCNYILNSKTINKIGTFNKVFGKFFPVKNTRYSLINGNSVEGANEYILNTSLLDQESRIPCNLPFINLNVHYDGKVSYCCVDFNQEAIVGTFPNQSLEEIWNSKQLEKIRNAHNNREHDSLSPLCQRCTIHHKADLAEKITEVIHFIVEQKQYDEHQLNEMVRCAILDILGIVPIDQYDRRVTSEVQSIQD